MRNRTGVGKKFTICDMLVLRTEMVSFFRKDDQTW